MLTIFLPSIFQLLLHPRNFPKEDSSGNTRKGLAATPTCQITTESECCLYLHLTQTQPCQLEMSALCHFCLPNGTEDRSLQQPSPDSFKSLVISSQLDRQLKERLQMSTFSQNHVGVHDSFCWYSCRHSRQTDAPL